ncbi:MAG: RsmE family RNA methyltransferase [Chloroflexota bacterium]
MNRFFLLNTPIHVGESVDLAPLAHQLHTVLRQKPGNQIQLLDNTNYMYTVSITALSKRNGQGHVLDKQLLDTEPRVHLTLYQCSLKADKFEWVLQKGTELGVSRFVPVISQRSITRPASALLRKYDRWQAIIREAAEQCGRGCLPMLEEPIEWGEAVRQTNEGIHFLPWEVSDRDSESLTMATRRFLTAHHLSSISLLIGPEGGISEDEASLAYSEGWEIVTLGPRILRAETAAVAAVAVVMAECGG